MKISATGIDGSNILAFDAAEFAETVGREAEKLYKTNPGGKLAEQYLEAMSGLTIKMENCTATFDNTTNE